ncbi:MAG: 16S rRNA (adenine(1518)-N(6)/adenine(1519)-N(6))-dimethyltransferase RsmA [Candidatus Micrarchaeia archaeon]
MNKRSKENADNEHIEYKEIIKSINPSKRLGQNFLLDKNLAKMEANFGIDKKVIEIGPGLGILTKELCKKAKFVFAIEKDHRMFDILSKNIKCKNLKLVNKDFFDVDKKELKEFDIIISNIPYNLSSKIIMWLAENRMNALLCLQKEFVDHMLAKEGMHSYSRLSVVSTLNFKITKIVDVSQDSFYPKPKIKSSIVYIKSTPSELKSDELNIISLLMMHKKKRLKNALLDSASNLSISKERLRSIAEALPYKEERVFKLNPNKILEISRAILKEFN